MTGHGGEPRGLRATSMTRVSEEFLPMGIFSINGSACCAVLRKC